MIEENEERRQQLWWCGGMLIAGRTCPFSRIEVDGVGGRAFLGPNKKRLNCYCCQLQAEYEARTNYLDDAMPWIDVRSMVLSYAAILDILDWNAVRICLRMLVIS